MLYIFCQFEGQCIVQTNLINLGDFLLHLRKRFKHGCISFWNKNDMIPTIICKVSTVNISTIKHGPIELSDWKLFFFRIYSVRESEREREERRETRDLDELRTSAVDKMKLVLI